MSTTHPPINSFKPGATWEIRGNLHYADGTPFNLGTGCSIQWAMRDADGNTVVSLSLASGGIAVLDAEGGVCYIVVVPSTSENVPPGSYTDQCRATDPSGLVTDQWQGSINVYKSFFD